jgi:hypothetical protein
VNDLLYPILALAVFVCWRQRAKLANLREKWPIIFYGVLFYALGEVGDLTSTVMGMNHGLIEGNVLMRDPNTFEFILGLGLAVKGLACLMLLALPSRLAFLATRRLNPYVCCFASSVLFWYRGWQLMDVTLSNLFHLLF